MEVNRENFYRYHCAVVLLLFAFLPAYAQDSKAGAVTQPSITPCGEASALQFALPGTVEAIGLDSLLSFGRRTCLCSCGYPCKQTQTAARVANAAQESPAAPFQPPTRPRRNKIFSRYLFNC